MTEVKELNSPRLSYRPEIDGLRSIAVISVILYHAQFFILEKHWFKGGYIGVDVFFVISGYLITRIILSELQTTGSFSFLNFYERRARRILPMLLVVIFVSIPFAWQKLLPSELVEYAKSILSSLFFGSNFFFYFTTTQYGAESSLLKPLLHTWSLGVEEQFYIVFPIVAIIAFKFFRSHFLTIIVALCLLSLQLADMLAVKHPDLNFYLTSSRFWELAVGSMLAYRELNDKALEESFLTRILPITGLFLIAHSILFFDDNTSHPSFYTITPILGVVLIIGFSSSNELVGKILGYKPFVWVGLVSYSAYMWHFPIFAFARMGEHLSNSNKIEWIILTFILSIISYFSVEKPFRSKKIISSKVFLLATTGFVLIAIFGAGYAIHKNGFGGRYNLYGTTGKEMVYYREQYWDDYSPFYNKKKFYLKDFPLTEKKNVYVIGNSWGHDIAVSLASSSNFNVQYKNMTGHKCNEFIIPTYPPSDKEYEGWKGACLLNVELFENIPLHTDIVVLSDNIFEIGQYEKAEVKESFLKNLRTLRERFQGKILIIKGRPVWKVDGYRLLLEYRPPTESANQRVQKELTVSLTKLQQTNAYYKKFFEKYDVSYASLVDKLCNDGICKLYGGGSVFYFDSTHMTREGDLFVQDFLAKAALDGEKN